MLRPHLRHWHRTLDEVGQPLFVHEALAEHHVERPGVRHKSRRDEHVAHQLALHLLHALDLRAPARVLARQAVDEAVGQAGPARE
eukprot:356754-Chlamydomonas_euryale.AAC.7